MDPLLPAGAPLPPPVLRVKTPGVTSAVRADPDSSTSVTRRSAADSAHVRLPGPVRLLRRRAALSRSTAILLGRAARIPMPVIHQCRRVL